MARDVLTGAFSGSSSLHGHTWGGAGRNRDPSKISSKKGALRSFPQWNRDPHIFSKYECQRPGMKRPG